MNIKFGSFLPIVLKCLHGLNGITEEIAGLIVRLAQLCWVMNAGQLLTMARHVLGSCAACRGHVPVDFFSMEWNSGTLVH